MTNKIKYVKVQYNPTGVIFNLPESDVIETVKSDRGNFEILDKTFKMPEIKKEVKTSTFEQVVIEDEKRKTELSLMDFLELRSFCKNNNIKYDKQDKKLDLITKIIEKEKNKVSL